MTCGRAHHSGGNGRITGFAARRRAGLAALGGAMLCAAALSAVAAAAADAPVPTLNVANLVELHKRFATFSDALPAAGKLGMAEIAAYEENAYFVSVAGPLAGQANRAAKQAPVRRVVFLKPATFVIDDRFSDQRPGLRLAGASRVPTVADGRAALVCGRTPVSWRMFSLWQPVVHEVARAGDSHAATVRLKDPSKARGQFIHVIHVGPGAEAKLRDLRHNERLVPAPLRITAGRRTFSLALPYVAGSAGKIEVAEGDKPLLPLRLLASGIMPHGARGVRMIEGWDKAYRNNRRPAWDTGRVATELTQAVASGAVKPGKAVVLGCGAGTNAVYLAGKGFDVTAIDIAPTALAVAETRAAKARVKVRWVLASVLAVPTLGPFDFMFDRGCYHGVRRLSAKGFVATAEALCRPEGQFLIIAGNANEERRSGPPRVSEKDIRADFSPGFDFQWLRETRFDGRDSVATGPLAWSIMLRRKADKSKPQRTLQPRP